MENRIREIRMKKKMTGVELAKKLNITPTYYYEIERGKKRLSTEIAAQLAEIFGESVDYLIGRSDDAAPELNKDPYALTFKDERDIAQRLEKIMSDLESDMALAFHGEPLEDEEDREALRASIENTLRLSKYMAKKKFTPNKYRK